MQQEQVSRAGMEPAWSFKNWGWIHMGKPLPSHTPAPCPRPPISGLLSEESGSECFPQASTALTGGGPGPWEWQGP